MTVGKAETKKKSLGSKTYNTGVSRLVTHASTKPSSRMLNFEVLMDLGAFTLIWSYDNNVCAHKNLYTQHNASTEMTRLDAFGRLSL